MTVRTTAQSRAIKAAGRETENMVVAWLRARGYAHAERRRLRGVLDVGDITGVPGLVIEAKKGNTRALGSLLGELEAECANDGDAPGLLIVRRRGITDVGRWPFVMTGDQAMDWWES